MVEGLRPYMLDEEDQGREPGHIASAWRHVGGKLRQLEEGDRSTESED
jgi:hypothetical protein